MFKVVFSPPPFYKGEKLGYTHALGTRGAFPKYDGTLHGPGSYLRFKRKAEGPAHRMGFFLFDGEVYHRDPHTEVIKPVKLRLSSGGYPTFSFRGRATRTIQAHRFVWFWHHGEIPHGHQVDHIDAVRSNYAIENLQVLTFSDHAKKTWRQRKERARGSNRS